MVYDLQGRELISAQANTTVHALDLDGLAAGSYVITSSSGMGARQFVKP